MAQAQGQFFVDAGIVQSPVKRATHRIDVGHGGHIVAADADAGAVGCLEHKVALVRAHLWAWEEQGRWWEESRAWVRERERPENAQPV